MSDLDTALKIINEIRAKKLVNKISKDAIKSEYADKGKRKELTDKERIDRIERLLGIE